MGKETCPISSILPWIDLVLEYLKVLNSLICVFAQSYTSKIFIINEVDTLYYN